jgi:hypothetical protein
MKTMLTAIAASAMLSTVASADTIKFHSTMTATEINSIPVGDEEDGHALILGKFEGNATLGDGSAATSSVTFTSDYIRKSGTITRVYFQVALNDGSALFLTLKAPGAARAVDGKVMIGGDVEVVGGKGKFADAKGEGTFNGVRDASLVKGVELTQDFIINLK